MAQENGTYVRPYEDRTHNTANEMTQIDPLNIPPNPDAYVPVYDNAGNLISVPSTDGSPNHKFVYDYRNRLIEVKTQGDANVAKYYYDGFNRRVQKDLASGTDVVYLYDGWQVVEERDLVGEAWKVKRQFTYRALYIDEPLIFDKDTDNDDQCDDARYFYAQQANFNVVAVTASDGTVVEKVKYDPYGEATVSVQGGQSASGSPYLFQGRRWDDESDLYYFRNRSLNPRLGRFIQRDPVGYADGMNLYQSAASKPVTRLDPSGGTTGFSLKRFVGDLQSGIRALRKMQEQAGSEKVLARVLARDRRFLSNPYMRSLAVLGNVVADIGDEIPDILSADCDVRLALSVETKKGKCCREEKGVKYSIEYEHKVVCIRPNLIRVRCKITVKLFDSQECPPGWAGSMMYAKEVKVPVPGTAGIVKVSAGVRINYKLTAKGRSQVESQTGVSISVGIPNPTGIKRVCAHFPSRIVKKTRVSPK